MNNKKATIIVDLVPEANNVEKKQIENEILKEAQIPWCAKIEKVKIGQVSLSYCFLSSNKGKMLSAIFGNIWILNSN